MLHTFNVCMYNHNKKMRLLKKYRMANATKQLTRLLDFFAVVTMYDMHIVLVKRNAMKWRRWRIKGNQEKNGTMSSSLLPCPSSSSSSCYDDDEISFLWNIVLNNNNILFSKDDKRVGRGDDSDASCNSNFVCNRIFE